MENPSKTSPSSRSFHLFFLVHGNHGTPQDFDSFALSMKEQFTLNRLSNFKVVQSEANTKDTEIGVELGGKQLADEIMDHVKKFNLQEKDKVYLSIVSHSLGGLFSRNAVSKVLKDEFCQKHLEPVSLVTINSPHVGARKPPKSLTRWIIHGVCNYRYKQTGQDLISNNSTLLELAKDDGVNKFKNVTLVALTHYDLLVPFPTAAVAPVNPFPEPKEVNAGLELAGCYGFDTDKYGHVSMRNKTIAASHISTPLFQKEIKGDSTWEVDNLNHTEFHTEVMKTLQEKSSNWRRIFLSCGKNYMAFAHGMVINKPDRYLRRNWDVEGSKQFIQMMVNILHLDHKNHVTEAE